MKTASHSPPGHGAAARFLVCEKSGAWATALRREPRLSGVRIHQLRSLADCREALVARPACIAALEATPENLDRVLEFITHSQDLPSARIIVLAARNLAGCQWYLREAGAVHVVLGRRNLELAASVVHRHLEDAPAEPDERQRITSRLPWAARAGGASPEKLHD